MKKLLLVVAFFAAFTTTKAQDNAENGLSAVLQSYYNIKDALVAGNNKTASENAAEFIKSLNGVSTISDANVKALLKDANTIADAKSIDKQRVAFSEFSNNMTAVAKEMKMTSAPVYLQYCPMKKAGWLSSEKNIKNPYYGNSMLTCGKVTETIQ